MKIIINKIKKIIRFLFLQKYHIKYYSQKGQDQWVIEEVFYKRKSRGYFLDLAASNGIHLSNTYVLEKNFGWNGICIEANDDYFKELIANRNCICDNSCIDGKKGRVKFVKYGGLGGIVDKDTDNNYKHRNDKLLELVDNIVWKDTITLEELLKKYNAPANIDFFSFDVEGAETRILKYFPFDKYRFLSIVIERPTPILNKILFDNGYVFIRKSKICNNFDSFYVHESLKNYNLLSKEKFSETPLKDW